MENINPEFLNLNEDDFRKKVQAIMDQKVVCEEKRGEKAVLDTLEQRIKREIGLPMKNLQVSIKKDESVYKRTYSFEIIYPALGRFITISKKDEEKVN